MNHPKEFAEGLSIGIIMDGNGRWAKQRGLPRTAGHKKGAAVFQDIANYCEELGVSSVTFLMFQKYGVHVLQASVCQVRHKNYHCKEHRAWLLPEQGSYPYK